MFELFSLSSNHPPNKNKHAGWIKLKGQHNYQETPGRQTIKQTISSSSYYTRCKCNCGMFGRLLVGENSIELPYSSIPICICRHNTIPPFLLELNPSHNKNRRRWSGFANVQNLMAWAIMLWILFTMFQHSFGIKFG